MSTPDLLVSEHGTIDLVHPRTPTGASWLEDNVLAESAQYFGGALAVEPRYLADLLAGARGDGLTVFHHGRVC